MKNLEFSADSNPAISNAEDLAYFIAMQESKPADAPEHSAEKWNQRAKVWKKKRVKEPKGNERVASAVTYLEHRGLLQADDHIVDIGCGPGQFAAAFAKKVHRVVGLDLSEKMVEHGMELLHQEGLTNATLHTCDFQTLDIEKEGYKGAFDLVFSSMTPAIHGMKGLMKSIDMSRKWCCNITHLSKKNYLRDQILQEVFSRKPSRQWTGRWFYSLFNVLFLLGYNPETSYETRHQEVWITPDDEYVEFVMEHALSPAEATTENADKISAWLHAHANQEGQILEISDASYGRILWDVRTKTERPDYRLEDLEV